MRRWLATVVAVFTLLTSAHALAQTAAKPTATELAEAKKLFDAGMKFYRESQFEQALAAFSASYRIAPRESTQRNIAQTQRDLKDMAGAYASYEVLLATYGDKMAPLPKAEVNRALDELAIVTGVVAITLSDPAAMVTVDDKDIGAPPKVVRLNVGSHTVIVTKPGFERLEQHFEVKGRDTVTVAGPLLPTVAKGHVNVRVIPNDPVATVTVDGVDVGRAPWSGDLDPGMHAFSAHTAAGLATPSRFDVASKTTHDIALAINKAGAAIKVSVDHADAEIAIDGKKVGSGAYDGPLAVGKHTLAVTKPTYLPLRRDLDVHDGDRFTEVVTLRPDPKNERWDPNHWRGVYGRFDFFGAFATSGKNNSVAGSADDTGTPLGGGFGLGFGYSFGWWGLEGATRAVYDHASATVGVSRYNFHRYGGAFTLGGRFQAETILRPTFGFGFGFVAKSLFFHRDHPTKTSNQSVYTAPTISMDVGIELGNRATTRFFLGGLLQIDFATTQDLGAGVLAPIGNDVFVGPILGLRWGS